MRIQNFMPALARVMAALMLAVSVLVPAQAAMIETEALAATPASGAARAVLADKLVALGVERDSAEQRVALLSDEQAAQVLAQAEELPAGAGALEVIGLIVVILIVTDLLGITDIFPFINKI
ncbi:MAG TPA: PA2779 family protein [Nevskiales bacterium]|nr:PA2779 family protein [Nevskiales bacterium]